MKKISTFFAILVAMILILPSCGGDKAAKVAEKINNKEEITQADYGVMIDYMTVATDELVKISEESKGDVKKMMEESQKLDKKYPYTKEFGQALGESEGKLDEANQKKLEDLQKKIFRLMGVDEAVIDQLGEQALEVESPEIEATPATDTASAE